MRKPRCLKCQEILSIQTAIDGGDSKPSTGDVAICFECGEVQIFQGAGFRLPTPEEFKEFLDDEDFTAAMAMVAVKNSKAEGAVEVVFGDSGHAIVLAPEPDEKCEMCGETDECRPYGPRKADGVRMRVCFPCAQKDPAEVQRAFDGRIERRS
jgi:hypothetical protein